jgi:hypothetical protein
MGMLSNLTAYTTSNLTNIIEGDDLLDESVSEHIHDLPTTNAVLSTTLASSVLMAPDKDIAPLTVPHLYWKCAINSAQADFPVVFEALMDHGADTVLISDLFASELGLKHQKLLQKMSVEMAMPGEGEKQIIHMSHWVKLQLYDPSGGVTSRNSDRNYNIFRSSEPEL